MSSSTFEARRRDIKMLLGMRGRRNGGRCHQSVYYDEVYTVYYEGLKGGKGGKATYNNKPSRFLFKDESYDVRDGEQRDAALVREKGKYRERPL